MAVGKHRGTIGAGTFSIVDNRYPDNVNMPTVRLADPTLVQPRHANQLLDGEFVRVGEGTTGAAGVAVTGTLRANQVVVANIPIGGAGYVDGARAINVPVELKLQHGRPGRTDNQFFGTVVVIDETENFKFLYRIIDNTKAYAIGEKLFVGIIANANLPANVKSKTSRNPVGLIPENAAKAFFTADAADRLESVAVVTGSKDANGWIECRLQPGLFIAPA